MVNRQFIRLFPGFLGKRSKQRDSDLTLMVYLGFEDFCALKVSQKYLDARKSFSS